MKRFCVRGHDMDVVGRAANRGCRACALERTREWRKRNPDHLKRTARERNLRVRGLTEDEFVQLAEGQEWKCAICACLPGERRGERRLHVDHDHRTGVVRGLLCQRCNIGLGQFQDSPELLQAAIEYLGVYVAS